MKKIISILLATLMLFQVVFISTTAETAYIAEASLSPIEATPVITTGKGTGNWEYTTITEVMPLGYVSAKGIKVTAKSADGYTFDNVAAGYNNLRTYVSAPEGGTWFTSDTIMIYIDLSSANDFYFQYYSGATRNMKAGTDVKLLEIGDTAWKTATVADDNTLKFEKAFKGYIKLSLSTNLGVNTSTKPDYFNMCVKQLGGTAGSVTYGPLFSVTKDSDSTEIVVPEAYRPAPIEATPITNWASVATGNWEKILADARTLPLSFVTAEGMVVRPYSTTPYENDSQLALNLTLTEIKQYTDLIMYVDLKSANTLKLLMCEADGWPWDTIKAGSVVKVAKIGDNSWSDVTVNASNEIVFDKVFRGYIKFNASTNFGNSSCDFIQVVFGGVGTGTTAAGKEVVYGNPVIGPFFEIAADSVSTQINVPDEYKPTPIEAKPTPNAYTFHPLGSVKANEIFPINITSAKGAKLTCSTEKVAASAADNAGSFGFYIRPESNAKEKWFDTDSIIMYVKTDAANEICPRIGDAASGSWWRELIAGSDYQYLKKGGTEWEPATVKSVTVGTDTKGVIEFAEAFEGYIKFNTVSNFNISNTVNFRYFYVYPKALGGKYGSVTIAPIFSITKDSNSTQIKVPDEYKPSDIKVNPITNYKRTNYYSGTVTLSEISNVDYTSAKGIKLVPSNGAYTKPAATEYASSAVRSTVNMVEPYAIDGMEAFVLYLDIPAANTVYPMFTVDAASLSYNVTMALKPGTIYYTLADGDTEWKEHTVGAVCSCQSTSVHGGMVFDSAFKGYVKFNPQNITCGDIAAPGKGAYIDRIDICFNSIDNAMIAGPYFSATTDSNSTNITVNKVLGDIDKDTVANNIDLTILRSYLIGIENSFVAVNGNINNDSESVIDITDLVKLAGIVDDIVFSADAYYQASSLSADVKTLSAYVCIPESINKSYTAGTLFGSDNGTAENYLNFGIAANGNPTFENGTDTLTFDGNVQTGDWAHLVYVIDDSANTVTVYLNGASLGSKAISGYTSVKDMAFVLGGDAVAGNVNYFKGKIGEVALYSTALSGDDVAAIYAAGTAANADIALWDAASTTVGEKMLDKVGNNHLNAYTTFFSDKDAVTDYAYSFAVVGDTQTITASGQPQHLPNIYNWILENKEDKKIEFVMGLGDITDGDQNYEWENAQTEISKLNGVIPYTVIRGNHDSVTKINTYFGTDAYIGQFKDGAEYYGFYVEDESDIRNTYRTFTTSTGVKYLILTLDFGPYDDVLTWADGVLSDAKFADHKVVVTTHAYLYSNGTTLDANEDGAATGYKYNGDSVAKIATNEDPEWADKTNNGDDIYEKLVKNHSNIVLVLSGHIINDEIVYRQDTYENGNVVTQMLIDPQGVDGKYNGVGLVALLYFSTDGNTITVEYYSTVKEQYFLRDNQFTIDVSNKN